MSKWPDQLRGKGRAEEARYFAERDRELLRALRRARDAGASNSADSAPDPDPDPGRGDEAPTGAPAAPGKRA